VTGGGNTMWLGGLLGYGNNTSVSNSYWNADLNNRGTGNNVPTSNSQGLTGPEINDIRHYADGTIGQVLAARAAEAAHQQSGTQTATNEVAQALKPSLPAPEQIRSDAFRSPAGMLDQNIVFADARNFSADIRRIEIDGKTFILDEEDDGKGKLPAVPAR